MPFPMVRVHGLSVCAVALSMLLGCADDAPSADGGRDVPADIRIDPGAADVPIDPGAVCDPPCGVSETCCADEAGAPSCVNTANDPENCGGCGAVCADGMGVECQSSSCVCGTVEIGCLGTDRSICCPPRLEGDNPYCANLLGDGNDCGECDNSCDLTTSDRCLNGSCSCGLMEAPCAGTPESVCCPGFIAGDEACVDTTSDSRNCGACGKRCRASEDCRNGICSLGEGDCESCDATEVCCFGSCCQTARCTVDGCASG